MIKPKEIDKDILIKVKNGDLYAFELLLSFFEKMIFSYILRTVKDEAEAADITQDTFIKVYKNRQKIDENKNIKTWIFTIATNTAYDFLRSRKRKKEISLEENFETIADTKSYYNEEGVGYSIDKALSQIPTPYRNALVLFYQQGFEYKEIAEILSIPLNTVKTHILRGKEQLRKQLEFYESH